MKCTQIDGQRGWVSGTVESVVWMQWRHLLQLRHLRDASGDRHQMSNNCIQVYSLIILPLLDLVESDGEDQTT